MPPQAPTPQQDPYEFIMNPQKPAKGPLLGGSFKLKILLIVIVTIIFIIGGVILGNILGAEKKAQQERLIEIAQTQTEIIRLATLAENKANGSDLKALNLISKLSVQSSSNEIDNVLKKNKVKVNSKILSKKKNAKNDEMLTQASSTSSFDSVYKKLLIEQISEYQNQLKNAFNGASKSQKEILNEAGLSNTLILDSLNRSVSPS